MEESRLSSLVVEKYANLLTREDIVSLFGYLEKSVGNKVETARICGLERKTTYDWEKTREIRLDTKKKVLGASMRNLPEETFDFMTEKSVQASVDVLRTYLFALYERAMTERNPTGFLRFASKFEEKTQKYSGLIADYLEIEVGHMSGFFPEKASELGVTFQPSPPRTVRLSGLSELLPHMIEAVSLDPATPNVELAKIFNIPLEFVETLSTALSQYYTPTRMLVSTEPELKTAATLVSPGLVPHEAEQQGWVQVPSRLGAS
jgi:hypothetical protein